MSEQLSEDQLAACKRASHILCSKTILGHICWPNLPNNFDIKNHFSKGLLSEAEFSRLFDKTKYASEDVLIYESMVEEKYANTLKEHELKLQKENERITHIKK